MPVCSPQYIIIGYGISGKGVARLIASQGKQFFVCDSNLDVFTKDDQDWMQSIGCAWGNDADGVRMLDYPSVIGVITSPGVAPGHPVKQKAHVKQIPIYSEFGYAFSFLPGKKIAVTGTNGKTTTVHLLCHILENAGISVKMGGNIGVSVSELALDIHKADVYVLEISSYQLERVEGCLFDGAVLTNITSDHCSRYEDFDRYTQAKLNIVRNLKKQGYFICRSEDVPYYLDKLNLDRIPDNWHLVGDMMKKNVFFFADNNGLWERTDKGWNLVVGVNDVRFCGRHIFENCAFAATAALIEGVSLESIVATIKSFRGLPHRLERVGEKNGVLFYNDSKATNPDAVIKALDSFKEPIILILGGQDKGADLSALRDKIRQTVTTLVLTGESTPYYAEYFRGSAKIVTAHSMDDAVIKAYHCAQSGDIVLLSPACASFDMYDNFEHRGDYFKQSVMRLQTIPTQYT
ncbi:MAG: UDP-N-acetylmuramoyl-L-alanine--D-glutamate ligase [Candidatus Auribacterota bacterium]|nr:UDP-N-acetylmuramoyl-L-alanine--D-glutamate ligase [Candidatus Auribacterota bacterium]